MVTGIADIEAEHAMQYKLLAEAERLFAGGQFAEARAVIRQLYDYTEEHFGSEQVIMRLHAYPGYSAHEREHGELLLALRQMHAQMEREKSSSATDAAPIRRWLSAHINNADRAFIEFVRGSATGGEGDRLKEAG